MEIMDTALQKDGSAGSIARALEEGKGICEPQSELCRTVRLYKHNSQGLTEGAGNTASILQED